MRDRDFTKEFYYFLNKVKNKENFTYLRFSDGEMFILQNKDIILSSTQVKIGNEQNSKGPGHPIYDKKTFNPVTHSDFRNKLVESFLYKEKNYYVGISCKCCVGQEYWDWQLENLEKDSDHLTWSNAFVNSNYPLFMKEFYPEIIKRGATIICNEHADLSEFNWVNKDFRIKDDSFTDLSPILDIKNYIKENKIENELFLFSAASLSNVAQYELYKEFPNNTYLDIGTTLSYEWKIPAKRGYLNEFYSGSNNYKKCIWN
jgi:hypothetical protein